MQPALAPLAVLVTAALAAAQAADSSPQAGAATPLGPLLVPIHTAAADGGKPYGLWAATDSYKVSFDGDVTFVPYLGPDRAVNQPLAWHTDSVHVGAEELLDGPAPVRRHGDFRCELDHGRVVEAWLVLPQGLEQTFVVRSRPAANGDLVVRGRFTTRLQAADCEAAHQALDFRDADGATIVRYGEARAIDARGAAVAVTTRHAEGNVELRVAAEWLATATFPITVDPLLTRVAIGIGAPAESIDVIRDDTGNDVMTVFTRAASASDHDAFALLTTDAFSGSTSVFTDVTASWSTPAAQVAVAGSPQKFCIAIERILPEHRIRAHLHDSGDFTLSTGVVFLTTPAGSHDWRPDIGGQTISTGPFTPTGTRFLMVFQRDTPVGGVFQNTANSGIFAATIDTTGALVDFPIVFGLLDYEHPRLNQQAARTGSLPGRTDWMVVYQRYSGPSATWRTVGRLVSDTGTIDAATWLSTAASSAEHQLTPRVGGQVGRYFVTYVETAFSLAPFQTTATNGHAWAGERVDWAPGSPPVNYPQRVFEGPLPLPNLVAGEVAYDTSTRSHWTLGGQNLLGLGGTGAARVVRVGYQGLETESAVLFAFTGSSYGVTGGVCFDTDARNFVVAFGASASTVGTVYDNRFTYVTPVTASTSGVACSSAQIAWFGSQQIGAEFPSLQLTSAPATVPAIAAVSLGTLDLNLSAIGMTGCRLLVDNTAPNFITTFAAVTNSSGASILPIPLPETLPVVDLYFQWFHFDIGANPLDLVSTSRVHVNLVK